MNNMTSAVWLYLRAEQQRNEVAQQKLAEDQFLLAAQSRPTRFRAKWKQSFFDGPTARRDAEEAPQEQWVETLGRYKRVQTRRWEHCWTRVQTTSNFLGEVAEP